MRYNTLGVQVSNTCNMACAHCITESSPQAHGDLEWERIEAAIRSAAPHVDGVCVTGGEPLLRKELTLATIQLTKSLGLRSSIVSNGYWGRSQAEADSVSSELDASGLDKLAVSYDRYHDRIVGERSLERLLDAGSRARFLVQVQYCGECDDTAYRTARDVTTRHNVELTTARVLPFGRGRDIATSDTVDVEAIPDEPCAVATRPVMTPEGDLFTCCGPARDASQESPLRLSANSESEVGTALSSGAVNPILNVIHSQGPRALLDQLSPEAQGRVSTHLRDHSICSLCRAITDDSQAIAELQDSLRSERLRLVALSAVLQVAQDQQVQPSA